MNKFTFVKCVTQCGLVLFVAINKAVGFLSVIKQVCWDSIKVLSPSSIQLTVKPCPSVLLYICKMFCVQVSVKPYLDVSVFTA